jgi:signal transduction histidine kinase
MRRADRAELQSQKLEAIGHLAGSVAHDFNNLIAVIVSCLRILQRSGKDETTKAKVIEEGLKAADRGVKIVQQLLSFARDKPSDVGLIHLPATIDGIKEILARSLGKGIALELDVSPDAPQVYTNATQFELALINLAVNARDAMPDGGSFKVTTRPAPVNGYVDVCIRDNGLGMTQDIAAQVFEPYFTTKPEGKGTGLGLAQAHHLAAQSGGTLMLETAPGKGALFTFRLPANLPGVADASLSEADLTERPGTRATAA